MKSNSGRWYGVITLFVIVAISYVDRINISVLINDPAFLSHMGIDRGDRASQGFLATAFMLGYGLSSFVVTPFVAALLGVRKSLICGLILWALVIFMTPYFHGYSILVASRFLLGVAEGPLFSLASSYIKAHFEGHENGKPNSFVNMGTGLGLAFGYPLIGYLLVNFHWDMSFYALGLLNVLLCIPLIFAFVHMPQSFAYASKPASVADAVARVGEIIKGALKTHNLLVITILTSAALAYLWGSSNWLPAYLKEARGFSLKELGWIASLPQYAIVLAVPLGGIIIDKLERRHVPLLFMVASVGVAASVLFAINAQDPYSAAYSLIAANFCWGIFSPAIPSTVQYYSRPEHTASAFGVVNGTGSLVAGLMPTLMGYVIAAVTATAGASGGVKSGFFFGFSMLIGTQLVVFVCGLALLLRERSGFRKIAVAL
ncbi:MAG: MFS transporter [Burkholderiaceae bacterium]|nr:MFS transporter [Burkholderiaceae bacterium]